MTFVTRPVQQIYEVDGAKGIELIPEGTQRIQVSYQNGKPVKMICMGHDIGIDGAEASLAHNAQESLRETRDLKEIADVLGMVKRANQRQKADRPKLDGTIGRLFIPDYDDSPAYVGGPSQDQEGLEQDLYLLCDHLLDVNQKRTPVEVWRTAGDLSIAPQESHQIESDQLMFRSVGMNEDDLVELVVNPIEVAIDVTLDNHRYTIYHNPQPKHI